MSKYRIENLGEFEEALKKINFRGMKSDRCAALLHGAIVRLKTFGYRPRAIKNIIMSMGILTSDNMPRFLQTGAKQNPDLYALELLAGMDPYSEEAEGATSDAALLMKLMTPQKESPVRAKQEVPKESPVKPVQEIPRESPAKPVLEDLPASVIAAMAEEKARKQSGLTGVEDTSEPRKRENSDAHEAGDGKAQTGFGVAGDDNVGTFGDGSDAGEDPEQELRRQIARKRLEELRQRSEGTGRRE